MEQVLKKANLQTTECQKVRKRLAEERMVLSEYSKDIGKVGDKQFIILVSQNSQGEKITVGCLCYCYDFWSSFAILHFPSFVFSNLHLLREEELYLFKKFSVVLDIINSCR